METKQPNNRLKAIAKLLLKHPNSTEINIKAIGGNVQVSKAVLMASSDVFAKLFEEKTDAEIELSYPIKIVQAVIESMHDSAKFDCVNFDVPELFEILKFSVNYDIDYLKMDITEYFTSNLENGPALINAIFHTYDHGNIGRDIYQEAIKWTIIHLHLLFRLTVKCCGHVYKHNTCCQKDGKCEGIKNKCCKHRSDADIEKLKTEVKRISDEYAIIMKDIPLRVYQDITKVELTRTFPS